MFIYMESLYYYYFYLFRNVSVKQRVPTDIKHFCHAGCYSHWFMFIDSLKFKYLQFYAVIKRKLFKPKKETDKLKSNPLQTSQLYITASLNMFCLSFPFNIEEETRGGKG